MSWDMEKLRKIAGLTESSHQTTLTEGSVRDKDKGQRTANAANSIGATKGAEAKGEFLTAVKVRQLINSIGFTKTKAAIQSAYDDDRISGSKAQSLLRILNTERGQDKYVLEGWNDDDYDDHDDPDVKIAGEDRRQSAFEKRNKRALSSADKEAKAKADEQAAKKKAEKDEPKAEAKAKDSEEKAEAKRRGKAPNPESKAQRALAKLKTMTRGEFLKWAADELGMGKNYASAYYARHNPKSSRELKEAKTLFAILHPFMKNYMLAENVELNKMEWVDESSLMQPMFFVTEEEANKMVKHMSQWKGQTVNVERFDFNQ